MNRYTHCSVTRIADLAEQPFAVEPIPREHWRMGQYVVGRVLAGPGEDLTVELPNGRMTEAAPGDLLIGALGDRHATLDATGAWNQIGPDGLMHALTEGGLFGKCTSRSQYVKPLMSLSYLGHIIRDGNPLRTQDFAPRIPHQPFNLPILLLIGSSMSAGKTTTARIAIRLLKNDGYRVLAAKLTGAGRYHDILSMADAGADAIFDFVDAGLPSTVCPPAEYQAALRPLLARMAQTPADLAIIEAGASPLEPYNGATAIREIGPHVRMTILCASDPYAVIGVMSAYETQPDLVTGLAANTHAATSLVEKLTHVHALNLLDDQTHPEFLQLMKSKLLDAPTPNASPWLVWTGLQKQ